MTKFNLGKFNLKSTSLLDNITGMSDIELNLSIDAFTLFRDSQAIESDIELHAHADATSIRRGAGEEISIELDSTAIYTLLKFGDAIASDIELDSTSVAALLGSELLQYNKSLILKPGDTMEIDLCDYTVTINGVNALHTEGDGGKWFKLYPGMNYLEITANGRITADIFWKDRWL